MLSQALDVRCQQCIDESGAALAMTHHYGRTTPRQWVVESVPYTYRTNP